MNTRVPRRVNRPDYEGVAPSHAFTTTHHEGRDCSASDESKQNRGPRWVGVPTIVVGYVLTAPLVAARGRLSALSRVKCGRGIVSATDAGDDEAKTRRPSGRRDIGPWRWQQARVPR